MADVAPPPYNAVDTSLGTSGLGHTSLTPHGSEQLQEKLDLNKRLLVTLSETNGAVESHAQQRAHYDDLQAQLVQATRSLTSCTDTRRREETEYMRYRDSKFKRTVMGLSMTTKAKFEERKEKEEREYLAAVAAEEEARTHIESLKQLIAEASKVNTDLESQAARSTEAQQQLDSLYSQLFDGPTREAPEEDRLEYALSRKREVFEQVSQRKFREETAVHSMKEAELNLNQARSFIEPALKHSNADRHGYDSAGYAKRDLMHKVEMRFQNAKHSMELARLSQPLAGDIGELRMPKTWKGDVKYDNYHNDTAYHNEIKETDRQLRNAIERIEPLIAAAEQRMSQVMGQFDTEKEVMEQARRALQNERIRMFEPVLRARYEAPQEC